MSDELVRAWLHPDLVVELKYLISAYEKKRGRKIEGGFPAGSLLGAKILRKFRLKEIGRVQVLIEKKNGTQKDTLFYLS